MAYNEQLSDRIREALVIEHGIDDIVEQKMFRGLCFMVKGKMCLCVGGDEMLCRIGAAAVEEALERGHCRQMMNNGRVMKDFVFVEEEGYRHKKDFDHWVKLALAFNDEARASGKKKK